MKQEKLNNQLLAVTLQDKDSKLMKTIHQFESKKKSERKIQLVAAVLVLLLLIPTVFIISEFTLFYFIGLSYIVTGIISCILLNRVDDFPDANQQDAITFLHQYRENTMKRTKKHWISIVLGSLLIFSGTYLILSQSMARYTPLLNLGMISLVIGTLTLTFFLSRAYSKRSQSVLNEISLLLEELK